MSKYIIIPDIKIINANAQPVTWMISAPAMTAYAGFAHALALRLGSRNHDGIAVIHHDIQFPGETLYNYGKEKFHPHQFSSAGLIDKDDYTNTGRLSSQPTARCHLNVSLIIAMPHESTINNTEVEKFLRGARLAGGSIISYGEVDCSATLPSEAKAMIKKSGFLIVNRNDLMVAHEEDRDLIDTMLRVTKRYKRTQEKDNNIQHEESNTDESARQKKESNAWILPTCLGYAGISTLEERGGSRNALQHLYVEPLVGLVQYKNIKDKNIELNFWRYENPEPNIFILTTN